MATTFIATRAAATFPVAQSHIAGTLCQAWGTIAVGANPTDGDIYQMCRVPAGATITGGYIYTEDLDAHATETLDMMVGWAANGDEVADPNGLLLAKVFVGDIDIHLDVASNYMFLGGVLLSAGPKTVNAETILQVECNVTAATFAAGQMSLYVNYLSP